MQSPTQPTQRQLKCKQGQTGRGSYSAVSSATTRALQRAGHSPGPVLENVWDVADGVTVGEKVPSACPVPVVVEPGTEDKIRGYHEEKAVQISAFFQYPRNHKGMKGMPNTHIMMNHVKKPQLPDPGF
jgi:hypothetical protein